MPGAPWALHAVRRLRSRCDKGPLAPCAPCHPRVRLVGTDFKFSSVQAKAIWGLVQARALALLVQALSNLSSFDACKQASKQGLCWQECLTTIEAAVCSWCNCRSFCMPGMEGKPWQRVALNWSTHPFLVCQIPLLVPLPRPFLAAVWWRLRDGKLVMSSWR